MDKTELVSSIQQIRDLAERCLAALDNHTPPKRIAKRPNTSLLRPKAMSVDFDTPMRPFIRQHAKGMNGQKKFTLLLSWHVKGDLKQEVPLAKIEKHWNTMKSKDMLGMEFNLAFSGRARDEGWVHCKRTGFYSLRANWKEIFKSSNG